MTRPPATAAHDFTEVMALVARRIGDRYPDGEYMSQPLLGFLSRMQVCLSRMEQSVLVPDGDPSVSAHYAAALAAEAVMFYGNLVRGVVEDAN